MLKRWITLLCVMSIGLIVHDGIALDLTYREGSIAVEGGSIWYQIVSDEATQFRMPLLVVHGGPGFPHDYLHVLIKIAHDRPVIFYDQLGGGHSTITNNDNDLWTIDRYEQELETLVTHLHLQQFHLFGHSWGGALAVEYTIKHPDTIKSLTLASPLLSTALWKKDTQQLLKQLPQEVQQTIRTNEEQGTFDTPDYIQATDSYAQLFVCRMKEWPKSLVSAAAHWNRDIYKTMWGPSEFTITGNLKSFDRVREVTTLAMPVLFTCGKYDEARPETLASIVQHVQQGQLVIYQHSAHMAFLEETDDYIKNLRLFLKTVEQAQ